MGSGYQWVDNGAGGVNYFRDGVPITREYFEWGTTDAGSPQDPGAIESWVAQQYALKQGEATGTSGTGTTAPTAESLAAALEKHNQNVKAINDAFNVGLFDFAQKEKALSQNREDIKTQMATQQGETQAYFSNVSPDAFQSQQGNYNQKILDTYKRNESNLTDQGTAIDFNKNLFNQQQQQAMANESTFNQATGDYSGGYTGYQGGLTANVPSLTPVTMSQVGAKLGVPSWSPNYGGMSVQQKQLQDQETIDKYLAGK